MAALAEGQHGSWTYLAIKNLTVMTGWPKTFINKSAARGDGSSGPAPAWLTDLLINKEFEEHLHDLLKNFIGATYRATLGDLSLINLLLNFIGKTLLESLAG